MALLRSSSISENKHKLHTRLHQQLSLPEGDYRRLQEVPFDECTFVLIPRHLINSVSLIAVYIPTA